MLGFLPKWDMVGMANVVFREYIKKRKKGKWYIFLSIKVGFQFYSKKKKKVGFQYSRALIYNLNLPPSIIELKKEKKKKKWVFTFQRYLKVLGNIFVFINFVKY